MSKSLPKVAIPTLSIFLIATIGFFTNIVLVKNSIYTEVIGFMISFIFLYVIFAPLHDASHGNVFNKIKNAKLLNQMVGTISGLLLLAPLPIFKTQHNIHHGHVNDPNLDPDHWVKGDNFFTVFLRMLTLYFRYYYLYLKNDNPHKIKTAIFYNAIFAAIIYALISYAGASIILSLWIYPLIGAMVLLALVFDFIPHYPHDDQTRYNNSRSIPSKFLKWIMLYQNYHIIHHLQPRVPFYWYESYYYDLVKNETNQHDRIVKI